MEVTQTSPLGPGNGVVRALGPGADCLLPPRGRGQGSLTVGVGCAPDRPSARGLLA